MTTIHRKVIMVALILAVTVTSASAQSSSPYAGEDTVRAWRRSVAILGRGYAIGYASGAMAEWNMWLDCASTRTVGELEAYLQNRADEAWSIHKALLSYHLEAGCQPRPLRTERKFD